MDRVEELKIIKERWRMSATKMGKLIFPDGSVKPEYFSYKLSELYTRNGIKDDDRKAIDKFIWTENELMAWIKGKLSALTDKQAKNKIFERLGGRK